jgi:hypothetical protein
MKNKFFILAGCALLWACSQPKPEPEAAPAEVKPAPIEIGDAQLIEISKQSLNALRDGNIDAYADNFADNAKFYWNYLDSLVGKPAIVDYWKERRTKVLDTLIITNEVWIALKANEAPAPTVPAGNWVFSWTLVTARYNSTGKEMTQWIHQTSHFDASGKVDFIAQYLDRVPIQAALKK